MTMPINRVHQGYAANTVTGMNSRVSALSEKANWLQSGLEHLTSKLRYKRSLGYL